MPTNASNLIKCRDGKAGLEKGSPGREDQEPALSELHFQDLSGSQALPGFFCTAGKGHAGQIQARACGLHRFQLLCDCYFFNHFLLVPVSSERQAH